MSKALNKFYRDRREAHLKKLEDLVPAKLYNQLVEDYRCVYQEVRNEVCDEMKRLDAQDRQVERNYGRMEEKRRIADLLGLSEAFDE